MNPRRVLISVVLNDVYLSIAGYRAYLTVFYLISLTRLSKLRQIHNISFIDLTNNSFDALNYSTRRTNKRNRNYLIRYLNAHVDS